MTKINAKFLCKNHWSATSIEEKEVIWINKLISELSIVYSIVDPIDLYCDNNCSIAQAREPISRQGSKHTLRRYHLIQEIINIGDVKILKLSTLNNATDPLTKPLAQQKHDDHNITVITKNIYYDAHFYHGSLKDHFVISRIMSHHFLFF